MVPGPPAFRKRKLNPALRAAVREAMRNGRRAWTLAYAAGFKQPQTFSSLLHAESIKATPTNIARFQLVADLVGFPRDQVFLADESVSA